ncbi:probable N-acetyltransferase camello isoform X2 [Orbicella faveolata]|uniref:probable N-acetyltransferase camello isoform X2 n=1 Tax=Orbicella faveolata TaxID=48498 RepID=UPI0009E265C3|nr:probable N-acetyltransferase camello isoform X2 [Orbicella faveolata]
MGSSDATQHWTTHYPEVKDRLTIRSFQRSDQKECVQIFMDGFQDYKKALAVTFLSKSSWYVGMATILASLAAVLGSTWIFVLFVFIILILLTFFYISLHVACYKYVKYTVRTDMRDIEKSYMSDEGCHMWVAELCGKVVGMVGLRHDENQEPGVFELQRMYVVPGYKRMGIGKRMLTEVITHAKKHRMKMIVLTTSNIQVPAIQLYMKYGFKDATHSSSANESGGSIQRPDGESILAILTAVTNFKLSISSS